MLLACLRCKEFTCKGISITAIDDTTNVLLSDKKTFNNTNYRRKRVYNAIESVGKVQKRHVDVRNISISESSSTGNNIRPIDYVDNTNESEINLLNFDDDSISNVYNMTMNSNARKGKLKSNLIPQHRNSNTFMNASESQRRNYGTQINKSLNSHNSSSTKDSNCLKIGLTYKGSKDIFNRLSNNSLVAQPSYTPIISKKSNQVIDKNWVRDASSDLKSFGNGTGDLANDLYMNYIYNFENTLPKNSNTSQNHLGNFDDNIKDMKLNSYDKLYKFDDYLGNVDALQAYYANLASKVSKLNDPIRHQNNNIITDSERIIPIMSKEESYLARNPEKEIPVLIFRNNIDNITNGTVRVLNNTKIRACINQTHNLNELNSLSLLGSHKIVNVKHPEMIKNLHKLDMSILSFPPAFNYGSSIVSNAKLKQIMKPTNKTSKRSVSKVITRNSTSIVNNPITYEIVEGGIDHLHGSKVCLKNEIANILLPNVLKKQNTVNITKSKDETENDIREKLSDLNVLDIREADEVELQIRNDDTSTSLLHNSDFMIKEQRTPKNKLFRIPLYRDNVNYFKNIFSKFGKTGTKSNEKLRKATNENNSDNR